MRHMVEVTANKMAVEIDMETDMDTEFDTVSELVGTYEKEVHEVAVAPSVRSFAPYSRSCASASAACLMRYIPS